MVETKEAVEKIKILKSMLMKCHDTSHDYKIKYRSLKKLDDRLDFFTAILNGTAIVLIMAGFTNPSCLLASIIISSVDFVITRAQDKMNFKAKYTNHLTTYQQYADLAREMGAVLSKNNMTSQEYQNYIEEINSKIPLIEDSQLI